MQQNNGRQLRDNMRVIPGREEIGHFLVRQKSEKKTGAVGKQVSMSQRADNGQQGKGCKKNEESQLPGSLACFIGRVGPRSRGQQHEANIQLSNAGRKNRAAN